MALKMTGEGSPQVSFVSNFGTLHSVPVVTNVETEDHSNYACTVTCQREN